MALGPKEALERNRRDALDLAGRVGRARVREHLVKAEEDLTRRLAALTPGVSTFTEQQMQITLRQVRQVIAQLQPGMKGAIVSTGTQVTDSAVDGVLRYIKAADKQFRGTGQQPLAIHEAGVLDAARQGSEASILRRLMGEPGKRGQGVLERYGSNVVGFFEEELRTSILARRSWEETREALVERSPFLKEKPASWSERITRTELLHTHNLASQEANTELDEQLGDAVKILCATFDSRTASDSISVHGQCRRVNEMFETWHGPMMHPPARPNDREIVVPHRIAWPIPKHLAPRPRSEVVKKWQEEKRKGRCPPTPLITTVPFSQFGRSPEDEEPKKKRGK